MTEFNDFCQNGELTNFLNSPIHQKTLTSFYFKNNKKIYINIYSIFHINNIYVYLRLIMGWVVSYLCLISISSGVLSVSYAFTRIFLRSLAFHDHRYPA